MNKELKKKVGLFGLTMIAVGSCIGSGIFIVPSDIAAQLGDARLIISVWLIGGVVSVAGSLTFAELGARFPRAGGVYIYIKEAFGPLAAFLYGWCILTVITSGAIAALGLTFARFVAVFVPLDGLGLKLAGASAIIAVTVVNVLGVKFGELFSSVFTVLKLLGITVILAVGVFMGKAVSEPLTTGTTLVESGRFEAIALALVGVMWSMGGWHHASYLSSEVKNARFAVPRAMILGAVIVTVTYILANWAYLRLLPLEEAAASRAIAADALSAAVPFGGTFIAVLIAVSTLGSIGIFTMSAPRVYYSLAVDGGFFNLLSKLSPGAAVPVNAILLQSGWALVILFFWGTFEQVITSVLFMDIAFMILAALSIFVFRRAGGPGVDFAVPLYPLMPLIYILTMTGFVGYLLIGRPQQALWAIGLLLLGFPVYVWNKRSKTNG